jgi:hypothetical protein
MAATMSPEGSGHEQNAMCQTDDETLRLVSMGFYQSFIGIKYADVAPY